LRAGPTWNGSGDSAAGRSAWRSAISAIAPCAVSAARARFADSCSICARCSAENDAWSKAAAWGGAEAASAWKVLGSAGLAAGFLAAAFFAFVLAGPAVCSLILSSGSARISVALFRRQRSSHKTLAQMNVPRPLFPNAPTGAKACVVLAGCGLLAGCIGNPFRDAKIDPASPVATEVAQLTRQPAKSPTFASIPNPPKDVRPAAQYGRDVKRVLAAGDALERATAPETWTLQGTEAFAETARKQAGPAVEPPKAGQADAFAREQRERATPPPPR
jgi:hypothetical protein